MACTLAGRATRSAPSDLPVDDERARHRLGARGAEPVSSPSSCVSACARASSENARWTTPARVQRLGSPRPGESRERERGVGRAEVGRRERRAGQLRELARDELGGAAAVDGARDRMREPDERVAGAADGALELPERRALQAVRVGARLHHRHHVTRIVRSGVGDDARLREAARGSASSRPPRRGRASARPSARRPGRCATASEIASSPFSASATTSIPGWAARLARRPSRASGASSQISKRSIDPLPDVGGLQNLTE